MLSPNRQSQHVTTSLLTTHPTVDSPPGSPCPAHHGTQSLEILGFHSPFLWLVSYKNEALLLVKPATALLITIRNDAQRSLTQSRYRFKRFCFYKQWSRYRDYWLSVSNRTQELSWRVIISGGRCNCNNWTIRSVLSRRVVFKINSWKLKWTQKQQMYNLLTN